MNDESAIERVVKAAEALGDYPRALTMMFEAGIIGYHTDIKSHTLVYRSDHAAYTELGEHPVAEDEPVRAFDLEKVRAAIRAFGRGEMDYTGFLRGLWMAGAVAYDVDPCARTITYRGGGGETHVRVVPPG